jgi:hypothetical protein
MLLLKFNYINLLSNGNYYYNYEIAFFNKFIKILLNIIYFDYKI